MSLLNNLSTASSGLGVSSTSMSVIGDNIANLNTVGFKGSRASFGDLLPNDVSGLSGISSIGQGAATDNVTVMFGQGALESTGNALDMAINGGGFFMVQDGEEMYYTRAGEFYLDSDGNIVNSAGLSLQGYTATDGIQGKVLGDLQVDTAQVAQQMTTEVSIEANLDSSTTTDETPIADGDFTMDGTGSTIDEVASGGDFTTSVTVYDSLGEPHDVSLVYEKTGENTWDWYAMVDGGELEAGFEDGTAFLISSGTLSFDEDGELTSFTQSNENDTGNAWSFVGASQTDFAFQVGLDVNGDETAGGVTQNASDSAVTAVAQDGYSSGDLTGISIDAEGYITGTYTNGEELALGQVALASFSSNTGLERIGGSLYQATLASGEPAVGTAGTGSRGEILGNAVEGSNVELEDEFVDMITAQRSYQANSRVFSSTNDLLQELVNLV